MDEKKVLETARQVKLIVQNNDFTLEETRALVGSLCELVREMDQKLTDEKRKKMKEKMI